MSTKFKYVRRLIAFAFRLGQLAEKKSILQYLSIMSADLPDHEPESIKVRFILQQVGKKIKPDLMSEYQGIFGEAFNSVQGDVENIFDYNEKSLQIDSDFVQEMETKQEILQQYLEKVKQPAGFILGEQ